jgi:hypothetical protein
VFRREHGLLIVACVLAAAGVAVILAGWLGAARSVVVAEQVPYLISGGLLGVALVFLSGLSYYGHQQSLEIREMRQRRVESERRHREVLATVQDVVPVGGRSRSRRPRPRRAPASTVDG